MKKKTLQYACILGCIILSIFLLAAGCDQFPASGPATPTQNASVNQTKNPFANVTFLRYKNTLWEYQIQYPRGWTKAEGLWGTSVAFIPPGNESLNIPINVNIVVKDISFEPTTLEEFTDYSLNIIDKRIPNSFIETSGNVKLAKAPAHVLVYTGEQKGRTYKWFQVYAIHKERIYIITFLTPEEEYAVLAPLIRDIVGSFQFV